MMVKIKFVVATVLLAIVLERLVIYDIILEYRTDVSKKTVANKHVIVTGASTGIGEEIAYRYAELGAKLVLSARRQGELERVAKKCRELGSPSVSIVAMDMGDPKLVDIVWTYARDHFYGRIDHLILNHIAPIDYTYHDYDVEKTKWLTQVNYFSYVQMATGLQPFLELSNGSIVVISSVAGKMPVPFTVSYSGTKHALHGFFGSLRRELTLLKSNVSISTVLYGLIGSANAKANIGNKVTAVSYAPPSVAAKAAVLAAVAKTRDVFYPWWMRSIVLVHALMPNFLEWTESLQLDPKAFAKDLKIATAAYAKRYSEAESFSKKSKKRSET